MIVNNLKDVEDLIVSEANDPLDQEELLNVAQKLHDTLVIADFKAELKGRLMAQANQVLPNRKPGRSWWWFLPTAAAAAVTFAVIVGSHGLLGPVSRTAQETGSGTQVQQASQLAEAQSNDDTSVEKQVADKRLYNAAGEQDITKSELRTKMVAIVPTAPSSTMDQVSPTPIRPELARMPALVIGGRGGDVERGVSMSSVGLPDYYHIPSAVLPAVPATLPVWRATRGIQAGADVMEIAARFGFSQGNLQEPYHFVKGTADLTIGLGNSNRPVSLTYRQLPAAAKGPALLNQQLVAAAVQFAGQHGLLPQEYHATARMEQDNGEIEVFIQPRLKKLPLAGSELRAVVTAQGEVIGFECLLTAYEPMGDYPLVSPAQVVAGLNAATDQVRERQDITIDKMELLYVWQDSPGPLPIIRPAYRLTGRDAVGQVHQRVVDAIDPAYTEWR